MAGRQYSGPSANSVFGIIALFIGTILFVVLYLTTTWNRYLVWLLDWGLVTFALYRFDKLQAGRRGRRVPEIVLHLLGFGGGVIGGWLGMFVPSRHKTRDPIFYVVLILSTAFHAALTYYLFLR